MKGAIYLWKTRAADLEVRIQRLVVAFGGFIPSTARNPYRDENSKL